VRTLAEFQGRVVILYFYPRDGTPGCTREACAFRDSWTRLAGTGAQVLGVSSDDVASHAHFARDHHLPFPLLADTDGRIARAYGVGSTFGLDARVTFIIDASGRILRVFPHVDPAIHANEVISAITGSRPTA
jgi:peroxiredoxin Q/BCP